MIRQLLDSEIAIPEATEEECLRRYENNRDRFVTGQIEEASHILLAARPDDSSGRNLARSVAETLIARLEADAGDNLPIWRPGFPIVPRGKHGGNLGRLTKGSTVAEFERALTVMSDGELRKTPLETRFGFHVLRLDRRIAGRQLPFELVGDRIAAWLEEASGDVRCRNISAFLRARPKSPVSDLAAAIPRLCSKRLPMRRFASPEPPSARSCCRHRRRCNRATGHSPVWRGPEAPGRWPVRRRSAVRSCRRYCRR